jgi:hypothetical protein
MKRRHKYGAKPTVHDGIRFASKREASRYLELKLLQQAGRISNLRRQVRYRLVIETTYVADFVYDEKGEEIVEDVKGHRTREYLQKKRQMAKQHNIEIRET